jgi:hypothetical protein
VNVTWSVKPAADFGTEPGELTLRPLSGYRPGDGQVEVLRADRVVYIADEIMSLIQDGELPWAQLVQENPWVIGSVLKIRGRNRLVIYVITGHCGPRVSAYLAEQPD